MENFCGAKSVTESISSGQNNSEMHTSHIKMRKPEHTYFGTGAMRDDQNNT